tara:strand:- start:78 stop:299 length:222 start_codon:yes stop_codon:yes gene_type:complete
MSSTQFVMSMFPICSAVFFAGYQVNRIDELFTKAQASEAEHLGTREIIYDIHGKVTSIEKDLKYMQASLTKDR